MVTGIIIGAVIVAIIWMCVYFNQRINDVQTESRLSNSSYNRYKAEDSTYNLIEKTKAATEATNTLISKMAEVKELAAHIDNSIEEGLMLLEEYDKRHIIAAKTMEEKEKDISSAPNLTLHL